MWIIEYRSQIDIFVFAQLAIVVKRKTNYIELQFLEEKFRLTYLKTALDCHIQALSAINRRVVTSHSLSTAVIQLLFNQGQGSILDGK